MIMTEILLAVSILALLVSIAALILMLGIRRSLMNRDDKDCRKNSAIARVMFDYIGKALDAAIDAGFGRVLLAGHIGKLVKLSGGMMNTHSREGDCRAELMAAAALLAGADADTARTVLDCVTTDEMLRVLKERGLLERTMETLRTRIDGSVGLRVKGQLAVGVIVFTGNGVELFRTEAADRLLKDLR